MSSLPLSGAEAREDTIFLLGLLLCPPCHAIILIGSKSNCPKAKEGFIINDFENKWNHLAGFCHRED